MADCLYHFTCRDGFRAIGRYNCVLRPGIAGWRVLWLTDQAAPNFDGCGLGDPVMLGCDRREFRYVVTDPTACRPWLGSPARAAIEGTRFLADMEVPGLAQPEHWWISEVPVSARWDSSWHLEVAVPP